MIKASIYALLYQLGLSASFSGFFYTAYAVFLAVNEPQRLLYSTKWLYPDVAKHYKTTWQNVEFNIRLVSYKAWRNSPFSLSALAGHQITSQPSASRFISILVYSLLDEDSIA